MCLISGVPDAGQWMSSVLEHSDKGVNTIVIGNKSDMKEDRKVDREMAEVP